MLNTHERVRHHMFLFYPWSKEDSDCRLHANCCGAAKAASFMSAKLVASHNGSYKARRKEGVALSFMTPRVSLSGIAAKCAPCASTPPLHKCFKASHLAQRNG